jgi:hypothetical protein
MTGSKMNGERVIVSGLADFALTVSAAAVSARCDLQWRSCVEQKQTCGNPA